MPYPFSKNLSENGCGRLSFLIIIIKGICSSSGALVIAFALQDTAYHPLYILFALILGSFSYGLSIFFYIKAQRELGAAKTSAYYTIVPFIGTALSFVIFRQSITLSFAAALAIMIIVAYLAAFEKRRHAHIHEAVSHEHRHNHNDGHHNHTHCTEICGEHSHVHYHESITHEHARTPDLHHMHPH